MGPGLQELRRLFQRSGIMGRIPICFQEQEEDTIPGQIKSTRGQLIQQLQRAAFAVSGLAPVVSWTLWPWTRLVLVWVAVKELNSNHHTRYIYQTIWFLNHIWSFGSFPK